MRVKALHYSVVHVASCAVDDNDDEDDEAVAFARCAATSTAATLGFERSCHKQQRRSSITQAEATVSGRGRQAGREETQGFHQAFRQGEDGS